jgi:glycosyltransferase involved in cell wall biosynthesis
VRIFGTVDTFIEGAAQDLRLGRLVANAQFLTALIRYGSFDSFQLFCPTVSHVRTLERLLVQELGALVKHRRINLLSHLQLRQHMAETDYAAFHVGGWGLYLPRLAHLRAKLGRSFPLTGVTHSLHTADIFTKMREVVATPFGPCDAIVCTSLAGQEVMLRHFAEAQSRTQVEQGKIVAQGLRFPRIPLGVDDECFKPPERAPSREALGLPPNEAVVLYLGRLSPYTKADLEPLIYAHANLCREVGFGGVRPLLVLAGGGDPIHQTSLTTTATELGIGDRVRVMPNVTDVQKRQLLASADVFVSPVDNHQETFGLAVVEAMAAGLPVVASDFDGYRDLINEGVTGFRVPTYGARLPPAVMDLIGVLEPNLTGFLMAQTVAVDIGVLAKRIRQLIEDPTLRRTFGAAGKERARMLFAWPKVIAGYEAMWDELREAARNWRPPEEGPEDPQVGDLHAIFAHYQTSNLVATDKFRVSALGEEVIAGRLPGPAQHPDLIPLTDMELGPLVLELCRTKEGATLLTCKEAAEARLGIPAPYTELQVIGLLKQGLLQKD